jgi:lipoxygenase homology domain-containing protein 1
MQVEQLTRKVAELTYQREDVSQLAYSPDGTKLAAGSHDNSIDVFDVTRKCVQTGISTCSGVY